ncbi:MAG: MarR family transcriptional regulator [Maledivibacter sp.]|nr:MarR family transcriptional regulator [Maledivibacter sp.]
MYEQNRSIARYNSLLQTKINNFFRNELLEIGHKDLLPSHGRLLSIVYINGGRVQIKTLYETMLKQKSTITEMINRLVKLGYLMKEGCKDDKRVTYVVVTEKTIHLKEDFDKISERLIDKLYEGFTPQEKDKFVSLMVKAITNFT